MTFSVGFRWFPDRFHGSDFKPGILNQFISALGKKDHALLLDCATLEYEEVPLDLGDYTIVITNTNAPHKLTDSQYNTRRQQCEKARITSYNVCYTKLLRYT